MGEKAPWQDARGQLCLNWGSPLGVNCLGRRPIRHEDLRSGRCAPSDLDLAEVRKEGVGAEVEDGVIVESVNLRPSTCSVEAMTSAKSVRW
jgi:hypothetical protein